MAEIEIIKAEPVKFQNQNLTTATVAVKTIINSVYTNFFQIAHIIASVAETKCYKDDGFKTVHEWTESAFGFRKTMSYSLLKIGKSYTREYDENGTVKYGSTLSDENEHDYTVSQIEKLLPAKDEGIKDLTSTGIVTPDMTAKEIEKAVKEYLKKDEDSEGEGKEGEGKEGEGTVEKIKVFYNEKVYEIPKEVFEEYAVEISAYSNTEEPEEPEESETLDEPEGPENPVELIDELHEMFSPEELPKKKKSRRAKKTV